MLYLAPTFLPVIFMAMNCVVKPPYWTYFEMPLQENQRLLLYPRQLMVLSCIQLNSLMKWQFSWEWLFYKGFHPFQQVATNGSFLLTILFDRIQQLLTSTIKKVSTKTKTKTQSVAQEKETIPTNSESAPKCLTTGEACHSTDNIFFDSDTDLLYLDTCATDSMSPYAQDFIPGTFVPIDDCPDVKGSGGNLQIKGYGTVRYSVVSDDGITYVLEVPDTAFVPTLDYRLLAPQYLKKVERIQGLVDHDGKFTTGFQVDETFSTLRYNGGKHTITIKHIPSARVPAMSINKGTGSYQAFCTEIDKFFPYPTSGSYALPTQRSDIDEDDSTFTPQLQTWT